MAEIRDLAPAELDRLEDALEQLEVFGVPDELRARAEDRAIVERLESYRAVLERSRASIPMVDVPPGLLDGVLAEARHGATPSAVPPASLWKRLRLTIFVPALAFAGAAALLVAVIRRDDLASDSTAAGPVAQANEATKPDAKTASGLIADASSRKQDALGEFEAADGERAGAAATPSAVPSQEQGIVGETRREEEQSESDARAELGRSGGSTAPSAGGKSEKKPSTSKNGGEDDGVLGDAKKKKDKGVTATEDVPKEEPPSPAKPASKPKPADTDQPSEPNVPAPGSGGGAAPSDVGWSTIEQADAQRRGGKCGLARLKYEQAKKSGDAKIRARALAGIGLCEHAEGRVAAAQELFAQARAQDPKVDAFIASEK